MTPRVNPHVEHLAAPWVCPKGCGFKHTWPASIALHKRACGIPREQRSDYDAAGKPCRNAKNGCPYVAHTTQGYKAHTKACKFAAYLKPPPLKPGEVLAPAVSKHRPMEALWECPNIGCHFKTLSSFSKTQHEKTYCKFRGKGTKVLVNDGTEWQFAGKPQQVKTALVAPLPKNGVAHHADHPLVQGLRDLVAAEMGHHLKGGLNVSNADMEALVKRIAHMHAVELRSLERRVEQALSTIKVEAPKPQSSEENLQKIGTFLRQVAREETARLAKGRMNVVAGEFGYILLEGEVNISNVGGYTIATVDNQDVGGFLKQYAGKVVRFMVAPQ